MDKVKPVSNLPPTNHLQQGSNNKPIIPGMSLTLNAIKNATKLVPDHTNDEDHVLLIELQSGEWWEISRTQQSLPDDKRFNGNQSPPHFLVLNLSKAGTPNVDVELASSEFKEALEELFKNNFPGLN